MLCQSFPVQTRTIATRYPNQLLSLVILSSAVIFSSGCAGIPSSYASSLRKNPVVQINLSPSSASVASGGQIQFSATLTSTSNTAVAWRASAGIVTPDGLFTAPKVSAPTKVTVTVTSAADRTLIAASDVTVSPVGKLSLETQALPAGTVGTPYNTSLTVTGGVAPYHWQISGGALPQDFALDRDSGTITGKTSEAGDFSFTASVTDANTTKASADLVLKIGSPVSGNFDGPAELPRIYVQSDLAHTPAPGTVISVPKGGDFQQALNRAQCGQTIELEAGGVYTGQFLLPSKSCDDNHWIIVRTSAPNSSLPPEGTRIAPCYAGVSSLPGRPAFHCTSNNNVLAKIQTDTSNGPIVFDNGANHYRFVGLEITRKPATNVVYNLVVHTTRGTADHIIFDRSWIHGTAHDETTRGVMTSGTSYLAVVDSYLSDFHCVALTGACVDSQAIAGGSGNLPMGPFKIVNNFLEAAAENILLGGDEATQTPADIEIRHNHLFKPISWKPGQPDFVGGHDGHPFIVKSLFELKNAQRILFEGNILENDWGGFTQHGAGIVLGPKNQAIGDRSVCPTCRVTDITIRYTRVSHVGGGLLLGNGVTDRGGVARDGGRYSIHDVTIDDIDAAKYEGYGDFAQVSTGRGAPILHDVTINHVTAFQPEVMLNIGDWVARNGHMRNFVYTNNLVNAGTAPTWTIGGGPANCAYGGTPRIVLAACFQNYTFSHNALIATPANYPPAHYPAGNFFPASPSAVNFVNYANGNGGDYHLENGSRYKYAATDGKDVGADINAIEAATAGAE